MNKGQTYIAIMLLLLIITIMVGTIPIEKAIKESSHKNHIEITAQPETVVVIKGAWDKK